jgi:hypothetical protein
MFVDQGFSATGALRLDGGTIGTQLILRDFDVRRVNLGSSAIDTLFLKYPSEPTEIDLREAKVRVLMDDFREWNSPGHSGGLLLDGFTYLSLAPAYHGHDPMQWRSRRAWLNTARFNTQNYETLAQVYRVCGRDKEARNVLVEEQEQLRRSGGLSKSQWLWNWLLGVFIGHGWRLGRPLAALLIVILMSSALFANAATRGIMVPTSGQTAASAAACTEAYPCFNPFAYTVAITVPVVKLSGADAWRPDASKHGGKYFLWLSWADGLLGWLLTSFAVIGVTGLARQR